ncbi:hypothetical protein [Pseudoalteromonas rubra]|uniref:Uncharacterized protein n=1 Tax=Pseudoalteromonas rubra TaxID=43658 RepID=A0A5S3X1I1_9GAMM|nr:hypothetical protein [Pseudoalteromonas rubra]TMP38131.1 hypothetical protein CWB98_07375 [Pseudoalteromonas rubra]
MRVSKTEKQFLIFNLLGACAFIWIASKTWIHPELVDVGGASAGSAVVWFFTALPVLVVFLVINPVIIVFAIVRWVKARSWPLTYVSLLSLLIWPLVIMIDSSRHGL